MNSMTRKGLALAAGLALASTALVAAPAQAAVTSLTLSPVLGSTYETVLGAQFQMKLLAPGNAGEAVKYFVEGAKAADFDAYEGTAAASFTTVPSIAVDLTETAVSNDAKTAVVTGETLTAANYSLLAIKLNATNITTTTTIKVTPFLDTVLADNTPGAGEVTGTPVSITFNATNAPVVAITLAPLGESNGTNSTTGVVTIPNRNMADTVGAIAKVQFKKNGGTATDDSSAAYDVTEAGYVASVASNDGNITALANGDVVSAQAFMVGATVGGAVATSGALGGGVASLSAVAVDNGNYYLATDGASTDIVRAGTGTLTFSSTVTAESTFSKAGQTVTFKVAEQAVDSLHSGASVSANGKTLTNSKSTTLQSFTTTAVSDADGIASITVSYAGLKDGNKFSVTASAVGADAATGAVKTVTGKNSAAKTLSSNIDGGLAATAASYQSVKGAAASVSYSLRDQFGMVPVGTFRALAQVTSGLVINSTVAFSNGEATVSWTDNSAAAGSRTITMDVEKLGLDGVTWTDTSETHTAVLVEVVSAAATPNRVTVVNSQSAASAILKEKYVTGDERNGAGVSAWNTDASITYKISGIAYSAIGGVVPGATVTVAAPGVLFTNAAKTVYSADSITVETTVAGAYEVFYASNQVGKKTFTVTSGTATVTTASTTFNNVLKTEVAAVSFAGSATSVSKGSTFRIVGTLTDAFGNPVTVPTQAVGATLPVLSVSYAGPGIVFGTLPTSTDVNGQFAFNVLVGANDTGTATVTASYDVDGDGSLTELDVNNFVVTHSVTVGAVAVPAADQKLNAGTFNGYVAVYAKGYKGSTLSWKIAGKWFKTTITSDYVVFQRKTVDVGVTVNVELYIDGVKPAAFSKTVTTK